MFGRRDENINAAATTAPSTEAQSPARVVTPQVATPVARSSAPFGSASQNAKSSSKSAPRKLTVGEGLSLSGEITACDILVVEGKVEAKLSDGKLLEIAESGQFRGSVEIENADIAGRYDGELTVHGRLTLRGTGRISGIVKYGELEISAGGQIIGELQVVGSVPSAATSSNGGSNFKSAAKYVALTEDEDETPSKKDVRKAS